MIARTVLLFALLATSTTVLTGAWFGSASQPMPKSATPFTPRTVPLDPTVVGLDAPNVLDQAIKRIESEPSGWLQTKIRQTIRRAKSSFVAEGFLQCGPNECVRLEMDVIKNQSRGKLILISDGAVLAKVRKLPDTPDTVHVENLPSSAAERQDFLAGHGAGGPIAMLRLVRSHLNNATLLTGMLGERPVIQIHGVMPHVSVPSHDVMAANSVATGVYLDAKTLMLVRVDWSSPAAQSPLLQIDFNDLELGRELTAKECALVFSYQPAGNESVTHK